MHKQKRRSAIFDYLFLSIFMLIIILPLLFILMNSFKGKLFIQTDPFALPTSDTFVGLSNYVLGITKMKFLPAFGTSLFVSVISTGLIVLLAAMAAWYLVRIKNKFTSILYYLFVFAMIVPFQMVMFPMVYVAHSLGLGNPWGLLLLYTGFGAGMSVFMYSGFIKSVPIDIEEAATIDGAGPIQTFFRVVFPIMKPTAITVAILNAMWIWNDFLLPYLVLDSDYLTIPIAVQKIFTGSYGGRDMGGLMAMLVLSIIPIIIFYLSAQKHIIKGVVAGAVKG